MSKPLSLHWHENLILILQPAHSPQLNQIERLWQFLKAQKGENFANLDALEARIQQLLDPVRTLRTCPLNPLPP